MGNLYIEKERCSHQKKEKEKERCYTNRYSKKKVWDPIGVWGKI